MNRTRLSANGSSFQPALPLQASVSHSMSQDFIFTAGVPVDSLSSSPVGVFLNPVNGSIEALAIVPSATEGSQICHVARDAGSEGGWKVNALFGGRVVSQVCAGTAYASISSAAVQGFFSDDSGVYATSLQPDGATWSDPAQVSSETTSNLSPAYSPLGRLVLYGMTESGDLLLAYQPQIGGAFAATICSMNGQLGAGDFQLCLTGESTWTLAANVTGQLVIFTGTLTGDEYASQGSGNFKGTVTQVSLGYWNDTQNTMMFLVVDSAQGLHVWSSNQNQVVVNPVPNSQVTGATGQVAADGSLHIYSIDANQAMWVLHQDANNPWNDDGSPNWAPYIPIDTQIGGVIGDLNPADSPSLFALDGETNSLRFHAQDPVSNLWRSGQVLQAAPATYEVVRFRTEVTLYDANGIVMPQYPVSLSVAAGGSSVDLAIAGAIYPVNSEGQTSATTDANGKLTIAHLTDAGMASPALVVSATGLNPVTIQSSTPVHSYLSGQGQLNPTNPSGPLPVFDAQGTALSNAKNPDGSYLAPALQSNGPLAPVSAQAIRSTALVGLGQTPAGVTGYAVTLAGGLPSFQVLYSAADLQAATALFRSPRAGMGDFWDDIEDWAGDVWAAIKSGLVSLEGWVVDIANQVVTFAIKVGDEIAAGVKLAIKGLEEAAHFIAGVFQSLAADIEKVIAWLKAMFDFAAIWRTKEALEAALNQVPGYMQSVLTYSDKVANGWFSQQEGTINTYFTQLQQQMRGQSFGQLPNWQGGGPPSQNPIAGGASPADFSANVHHNWLQDKFNSYAPSDSGISANSSLETQWGTFSGEITGSYSSFVGALKSFVQGLNATITDPSSFSTMGISDFLGAANGLVQSLLQLCDAILNGFVLIADVVLEGLQTLLTTELNLGPINTLWSMVANLAGSDDDTLTMSSLFSLLAAFPCTIVYKLIEGSDQEPFPPSLASKARAGAPALFGTSLAADILQILYTVPAVISDILGQESPWFMTAITMAGSMMIFGLQTDWVDLSTVEWDVLKAAIVVLAMLAPLVLYVVSALLVQLKKFAASLAGDPAVCLIQGYGELKLVATVVLLAVTQPPSDVIATKLLLCLPNLFSFCQMAFFQDDEYTRPFATATNVFFDTVGYAGGGICELVYLLQNPNGSRISNRAAAV